MCTDISNHLARIWYQAVTQMFVEWMNEWMNPSWEFSTEYFWRQTNFNFNYTVNKYILRSDYGRDRSYHISSGKCQIEQLKSKSSSCCRRGSYLHEVMAIVLRLEWSWVLCRFGWRGKVSFEHGRNNEWIGPRVEESHTNNEACMVGLGCARTYSNR